MDNKLIFLRNAAALFILVLIAGCASSHIQPVQKVVQPPPLFPPQAVMQTGDYRAFLAKNSEMLKSCQDPDKCAIALFNLSFLYCYPKSPYYSPRKGLQYIADLVKGAPQSPWASQAMVWKDLVEKKMKRKIRRRPMTALEELKAREAPDDSASPAETPQESDWEVDRLRMENEIKYKDEIIKELTKQIERSRQIDIEMEKKERGLLH